MYYLWLPLLLSLAAFGTVACGSKEKARSSVTESVEGASLASSVTYEGFVKGWLKQKCTKCHAEGRKDPDLTTYSSVKKNADEILESIQRSDDPMPPDRRIPKEEIEKLKAWVAAKMPRGEAKNTKKTEDNEVQDESSSKLELNLLTYDDFFKPWLDEQCVSCHATGRTPPNLSSYDLTKQNIDEIIESIQNEDLPMPPQGLPDAEIVEKFKAWRSAGMPKSSQNDSDSGTITMTATSTSTGTSTGASTSTGANTSSTTPTSTSVATSMTTTTTATSVNVTYESFIRGYLTQKCTSCHNQGGSRPNLSNYNAARAAAEASLRTIDGTPNARIMPPSATGRESVDIISRFQTWIRNGTPQM